MNTIRTHVLALLSLTLVACGSDEEGGSPRAAVDFSKPEAVLTAVFDAAKRGDDSQLAGLCAADADKDARRICNGRKADPDWASFLTYFSKATLNGAPRIDGTSAEVDFLFGPDGTKPESMRMVQVDGKWLLSGF